jgi:hypothetical protein
MMTSKKMMKEMPKRDETVIYDDPRIGIGISTLSEPRGFKQKVESNEFYPLEVTVLTSTTTDSMFEHHDDDVPVRFSPRYIGATPEISSEGRFNEETGKVESKPVKKLLFPDNTVVLPSDGRNLNCFPGHFKSKTAVPDVLYDPNAQYNYHTCNKNDVSIGFGCPGIKITPSVVSFVDNINSSEVNCSHKEIKMVKTMPTDCNSRVDYCGIDDLPAAECARTTETVVMTQCIFENAFVNEWTVTEADPVTITSANVISILIQSW